jgi:hypothetical protein
MNGLVILLGVLSFIYILILMGMNIVNSVQKKEAFTDGSEKPSKATKPTKVTKSPIEIQIRKILDSMNSEGLCPLYKTIRTNMAKNEKAGQDVSDQEVNKRVEAALALKIPGGALPCPLLNYPKPGSTDLEWLDFLQQVPSDFGARVVLMAIYAQGFLADKEQLLKDALSGNGTPPISDGFTVCSPDVATSRRAEKKGKEERCTLPEDLRPEDIQEAVTTLLKTLVAKKNTILKEKKIDPTINVEELIKKANASAAYVSQKSEQAESGSLQMDGPIQKPAKKDS